MKLRLLLTEDCNRACPGCCNKDWDLDKLPVCSDYKGYDMIMLTGGEPMLYPIKVLDAVKEIRLQTEAPIIVYTAYLDDPTTLYLMLKGGIIDGITLTLHTRKDKKKFKVLDKVIGFPVGKMLRLNVFKGVGLNYMQISPKWNAKMDIVWLKDCPLPKDEVFMRYEGGNAI